MGGFSGSNRENRFPDFTLFLCNKIDYTTFLKFPYVFPYGKPIGKTVFPVFPPPIIDRRRNGKTEGQGKGRLPTPLALSVDRLGRFGRPTWVGSVDRLGRLGRPTAALRWTDSAGWVDRLR